MKFKIYIFISLFLVANKIHAGPEALTLYRPLTSIVPVWHGDLHPVERHGINKPSIFIAPRWHGDLPPVARHGKRTPYDSIDKNEVESGIDYYERTNGKYLPRTKENINFKTGSAEILAESYQILKEYGSAMEDGVTNSKLIIEGHTDSIGSIENNIKLSRKRAAAVKLFLIKFYKISPERLIVKAFGEARPIASNKYKNGRKRNRRVEFVRIE